VNYTKQKANIVNISDVLLPKCQLVMTSGASVAVVVNRFDLHSISKGSARAHIGRDGPFIAFSDNFLQEKISR